MPHHTLSYDPLMRLHESKVTSSGAGTRFAYDGLQMLAEYDTANVLQKRYVFGPGIDEPLVEYTGSGTTSRRWLHADERGSIVAMSDGTGVVTNINRYDEFGKPQSTNAARFQYTGQAWLPELNAYYYKARVYAPHIGRFLQTDPIGYESGPNLYAYVLNDPVNFTDPLGMLACGSGEMKVKVGGYVTHPSDGSVTVTAVMGCMDFSRFDLDIIGNFNAPIFEGGGGGSEAEAVRPCSDVQELAEGVADATDAAAGAAADAALVSAAASAAAFRSGQLPQAALAGRWSVQFTAIAGAFGAISVGASLASGNSAKVAVSKVTDTLMKRILPFLPDPLRDKLANEATADFEGKRCRTR